MKSTCNIEKTVSRSTDFFNRANSFSSPSSGKDIHFTPIPKTTFASLIRKDRRKARIEALKSLGKYVLKVILILLISITLMLMTKTFATEMTAILRLEDSFDTEIPLHAKIIAAFLHSTPCAVKDRNENYNVFFNLKRYLYLFE